MAGPCHGRTFGVLIVRPLIGGPVWIMSHIDHTRPSMDRIMQTQR